jgi:PAS domain S-box-containing protein
VIDFDLAAQLHAAEGRLQQLQRQADRGTATDALLPNAIEELSASLEELSVAVEELKRQNTALLLTRNELDHERQRYQRLFDFSPDAYLVTNGEGVVLMANQSATTLLGMNERYWVGKPLTVFIALESYSVIYHHLTRIQAALAATTSDAVSHFLHDQWLQLRPRQGDPFPASLSLSGERLPSGEYRLHWAFRDMRDRPPLTAEPTQPEQPESEQPETTRSAVEARLQTLLDASPATTYSCEASGDFTCTYISNNVETLLGYTAANFQSESNFWKQCLHPDDASQVLERIPQLFEQGRLKHEYRLRHQDGHYIWVCDELILLRDETGCPIEIVGYVTDISDRKQKEQRLQYRQTQFASIIEHSPSLIYTKDLAGRHTFVNPAFLALFGCQLADIIGKTNAEFFDPDTAAQLQANDEWWPTQDEGHQFEETLQVGNVERVFLSTKFVLRDAQGEVCGICGISTDITRRKVYEQDLKKSRDRLQAMVSALPDLVFRVNREGQYLDFHASGFTTGMVDPDAVVGRTMTEVLPDDRAIAHLHRIERALTTQTLQLSEQQIDHEGQHRYEEVRVAPCGEDEVVFIIRDITDRKQAELALSNSQQLPQNDIQDVAKIESGQITLHRSPVSVEQLCSFSLAFVKQQALKKRIQLQTQIPPRLPDIRVDETRMRQVLLNLLTNAVKFTPEGGTVTLAVSVLPENQDTSDPAYLRLAVTDTGIGIAPENIPKLFKPFAQIDGALNRQQMGTGLGLALTKQIAELHGGRVALTSELGVGSCFTVEIPYLSNFLLDLPPEGIPSPPVGATGSSASTATQTPLIVWAEDNADNIETISCYLEAKGYELLLANNGQEAIDLALSRQPDLILMDIQMPGVDGLEAIQCIRQENRTRYIPIIAITALAMEGDRDRCIAAGADEYISKPIRLKHLSDIIQSLLNAVLE